MAGYLWNFGNNQYGELGDNTTVDRSSPVQTIGGGTDWSYVGHSNGYHRGAVKKDGTLWCWGKNDSFQLGDESSTNRSSPVQTAAYGNTWQSVDCGFLHTAGIKTDGTLWLWGKNSGGQIGNDSTTDISSPVQTITYSTDWSSVSCGFGHTAAIKTDGTLWLWGGNNWGGLGDNTTVYKSSPIQTITGGTNWSKVACGNDFTAAVKTDGTLWTWGYNYQGQIGDGTQTNRSSPVQTLAVSTDWENISCGSSFCAATKKDGTLWLWGENFFGNLGDNTSVNCSSPIQTITNGTNWDSISAGSVHVLATKQDGVLWSWGYNNDGGLGDNQIFSTSSPVQTLLGAKYWISLGAGNKSSAVISSVITLQLTTPIAQAYSGAVFGTQPVISFLDESSNVDTTVSLPVTVSVTSGNATLSGTTTVNASSGVATFTDLKLTGFGQVTLTFASSAGITSVSQTLVLEIPAAVMPKRSETASSVPTSGQLRIGELAINIADKKGYVKKSDGTIVNVFSALSSGAITSGVVGDAAVLSGNIASGQIGTNHLASGVLSSITLSSGQVTSGTIASGSVSQFKLSSGAVNSGQIGNNAVVSGSIASGSIHTFHISSGSITTNLIASGTIVSEDLSNEVIVSGKVSSGVIAWFNLASGAVRSGTIGDAAVVSGSIASGSIGWSAVSSGVVRSGHIGNGAVVSGSVASGQIGLYHLASGTISTAALGSGQVISGNIASGTVNNFSLSSGAVLSGHIGNNAVVSGSIASGSVGQFAIASGSITAEHIASGAVINADIADNAVTSGKIASGTIGTIHISSGGVQNINIASGAVLSGNIASGSIGSFHISSGTYVTNTNRFPVTASGVYYIDLAASLSGSAGTFTSSGLVFNPRSGGTLGIGDVTNPTSRLTVTHSSLYPAESLQTNTATLGLYSGGATSGFVTYGNTFITNSNRGSSNLTTYAVRVNHGATITSGTGGSLGTIGGILVDFADVNGNASPTHYGIRINPHNGGQDGYGLYVAGTGGANATFYGIYSTATNFAGNGNWGIYAEASNTGGIRPAIAAQFKIAGNVTSYARGLVVDAASATVSRDYYGAIIDATNITALSGKIALYVSDGTSTATFGNGSGGAALFTGGNVGIRTTTPSGTLHVETGSATRIGEVIRGFTSQTANLTEWQNSANTVYARVNASGEFWGLIASGIVTSGGLGNAAVVSGSIASGQISTFHIASGSITADLIASGAIITADIADNAVVSGKIASGVVAWFNLASGAVRSGHIGDNAVVSGSIASGQIWTFHFASGALIPDGGTF